MVHLHQGGEPFDLTCGRHTSSRLQVKATASLSAAASLQASSAALQHDLRIAVDSAGELLAGASAPHHPPAPLRRRATVVWIIQAVTFFDLPLQ
jgi:hypothetical protein